MKWPIIVLIMLSLVGSMMWVMPTARQRFQSKLRLAARQKGFNVSLANLALPRAQGEMEGEKRPIPCYKVLRTQVDKKERERWIEWGVCRVRAQANTGLPDGWSWIKGEYQLDPAKLTRLSEWLTGLGEEIVAVESDPLHLTLYWTEPEREGALDDLYTLAQNAIAEKI